ncbi:VWA domain-containing protein [Planktothrix sp. FACHB-1365]|uniref:VWA domain-containing protein n=1 Tax=Planktothrix sp. FACHB-1365 TaxID=2692855 RepID=UPI0016879898|nr:VWA domain-containing protein [Planktothrix sp. FACHB-1365]MBD2482567.1 VWA domain-containing protein [Planktothrix sp. FACHB-1365]
MIDLENRDYTLIIDKSGTMARKDCEGGRSRWEMMQETTFALASKCEQFDQDGITVYTFSTQFRRYDHVTASKVEQIFNENEPVGRTEMAKVLQDALENYFQLKKQGQAKLGGETIIVVTDGQPDHPQAVIQTIIEATQKIDRDEELAISFIQIGHDTEATQFLKTLDDDLQSAGARFDIVHTITIDEIEQEGISLKEVLIRAITD